MTVKKLTVLFVFLLGSPCFAQTEDLPTRFTDRLETLYAEAGVPGIQAAYIIGDDTRFSTAVGTQSPFRIDACGE